MFNPQTPNPNYAIDAVGLDLYARTALPEAPEFTSRDTGLTNIFLAHYYHSPCQLSEHQLPMHVLEIIDDGANSKHQRRLGDDRNDQDLRGGELFFYPAHVDHGVTWDQPVGFSVLLFHPVLFDEELDCGSAAIHPFIHPHDAELQYLARKIILDIRQGCPQGHIYSDTYALALALEIARRVNVGKPQPKELPFDGLSAPILRQVKELIHTAVLQGKPLSLVEMATVAEVSQSHFLRLFKAETGRSPHAYYNDIRLDHAANLLRTTPLKIAEVSLQCGFNDQSYFSRCFKKKFKITPSAFCKEFRRTHINDRSD
ncbi:MAG: helix-turn-helix transcriptional regulator [Leptolyngbyaceae cyanobacterium]